MANRGRPRKANDDKKRVISISITPLQLNILEHLCQRNDVTRSEMVRAMIEGAGYLELGVVGGVQPHIMPVQTYILPQTGFAVCNPYSPKGFCENDECQGKYQKEGLI
jgi:hypothetical protein